RSLLLKATPLELGSFRREDRPGAVRAGSFFLLKAKTRQRLLDPGKVARAEQPDMHEPRVEVVDGEPGLVKARLKRHHVLIGIKEGLPKRAEEGGEGKFDLRVPAIDGWIHQSGDPAPAHKHISTPKVAVQKARESRLQDIVANSLGETLDAM